MPTKNDAAFHPSFMKDKNAKHQRGNLVDEKQIIDSPDGGSELSSRQPKRAKWKMQQVVSGKQVSRRM